MERSIKRARLISIQLPMFNVEIRVRARQGGPRRDVLEGAVTRATMTRTLARERDAARTCWTIGG
ncbi:MAG TPA: hypothetical protein VKY74_27795 [Chloroflexia bacterium]|nr:hypothetical protein [Chloroflexia bacterium]